jgi:SAM-dependent methyltransferase
MSPGFRRLNPGHPVHQFKHDETPTTHQLGLRSSVMLRRLRWQRAKRRLASVTWKRPPGNVKTVRLPQLAKPADFPPNAEGYSRLASVWDEFASWFVPDYAAFLADAGEHFGLRIGRVLELACGTGITARRLAKRFESVVGLDSSEPMLREARSRSNESNVRYLQGDFRDFNLGETFDAIVCSSDSINYIEKPAEILDVFRCAKGHLSPGGLFVFDALNQQADRALGGTKVTADVDGTEFEIYYFYDPIRRVSEDRVVFDGLIERHRRIPIDEEDVRWAAGKAGLEVTDYFTGPSRLFLILPFLYVRHFYVLRRPDSQSF